MGLLWDQKSRRMSPVELLLIRPLHGKHLEFMTVACLRIAWDFTASDISIDVLEDVLENVVSL
jgi:hypothetical protein